MPPLGKVLHLLFLTVTTTLFLNILESIFSRWNRNLPPYYDYAIVVLFAPINFSLRL